MHRLSDNRKIAWKDLEPVVVSVKRAPPLPTKPGGPDNWVERHGVRGVGGHKGLPSYIDRVARHIYHGANARKTVGTAIAGAISRIRHWLATSKDPAVKKRAAQALAQWQLMKRRANASHIAKEAGRAWGASTKASDTDDAGFLRSLGYEVSDDYDQTGISDDELLAAMVVAEGEAQYQGAPDDRDDEGQDDEGGGLGKETNTGSGAANDASVELSGPIVEKSRSKQIGYAAVLVPGEADTDGDVVDQSKIEEVAHDWLQNHRYMDEQHTLQDGVAHPVESYLLPAPMDVQIAGKSQTLPTGTWIVGAKIQDDAWRKVVSGELDGLSVMGVRKTDYENAINAAQKSQDGEFSLNLRRVTLQELGDFITPAVSLVKGPAVGKAKWFAFKSKESDNDGSYGGTRGVQGTASGVGDSGVRATDSGQDNGFMSFMRGLFGTPAVKATSDEEVLNVEITKDDLKEMIEEAATKAVSDASADSGSSGNSDNSGDGNGGSGDDSGKIEFESQKQLDDYIQEQVDEILGSGDGSGDPDNSGDDGEGSSSDGQGGQDDDDSDEDAKDREIAAMKSRIEELERGGKTARSTKSRHLVGNGSGSDGGSQQSLNETLGRDSFGRKIPG